MKNKMTLNSGNYPAMLTPYTKDNKVDYNAVAALTKWYAEKRCDGIFCDCLSSEIYFLSLEERLEIARTTLTNAPEGVDVVVSGHATDDIDLAIKELSEIAKLKPKALILIVNRLAKQDESDDILKANATRIMNALPEDLPLGLYEAPLPYNRLLSPELLKWFADTGRFIFLKDTCCRADEIKAKLKAIENTPMKLYNANTATLLETLAAGAHGYCGVMCNYHPELYKKLFYMKDYESAEAVSLQNLLSVMSLIQYQMYPLNAKYYLQRLGLPIESWKCRSRKDDTMDEKSLMLETDQLMALTNEYMARG